MSSYSRQKNSFKDGINYTMLREKPSYNEIKIFEITVYILVYVNKGNIIFEILK